MAYGYRRRRYTRRRRRYPRKGNGATDYIKMAKAAYSGVNYLRSIVNVEKKFHNASGVVNPDNVTGIFQCLNLIAQGDGPSSRDGNSLKTMKIFVNLNCSINASAASTALRIVLFVDKEANGLTPTISDIFSAASVTSNYNHNESSRFFTLSDKTMVLTQQASQGRYMKVYRRLGFHIHFDGTAATVANVQDNNIWLFFISDESVNLPQIAYNSQLIYVDN